MDCGKFGKQNRTLKYRIPKHEAVDWMRAEQKRHRLLCSSKINIFGFMGFSLCNNLGGNWNGFLETPCGLGSPGHPDL